MPSVMDLVNEVTAMVQGEKVLTKQASLGSSSGLSPEQMVTLADRLEKAGHVQDASARIVEMRKEASASPEITAGELKKLAYQQALRELGFRSGRLNAVDMFFGNMNGAQSFLAKEAADAASILISQAIQLGLQDDEEVSQ